MFVETTDLGVVNLTRCDHISVDQAEYPLDHFSVNVHYGPVTVMLASHLTRREAATMVDHLLHSISEHAPVMEFTALETAMTKAVL